MALSVSIHIHFPPTWLFHGISIKLGAHRPQMWGSSKHTSTFSHLSSGMCGSPSDCCGHVCVQARHREVGYIACLLVTYGTAVWVGGACNIHDPWSFVDVFPHFEKYTGVKSGLCANYLTAASELQFCGGLFVFAPSASLNAKKWKWKKSKPVRRSRQLPQIGVKVKQRTAHFQGFVQHLLMLRETILLSTSSTQITTSIKENCEGKQVIHLTWRAAVCPCCSATPAPAPPSFSSPAIV